MCQSVESDRRKYLLWAKCKPYQERINKAKEITHKALSIAKKPLLSFSGGKDSIVLLDIAIRVGFHGDLLFFKYGISTDIETPPENIEILRHYAKRHGLKYHILKCEGETDCWEQIGRFTLFPKTVAERRIFNRTNYDYRRKSEIFCREYGADLQLIGMRKAESKTRRMILNKKGYIYATKSRESATCCPLAQLTADDIWAYIFSYNLPYLAIYDDPYLDRRTIRNEHILLYNHALVRHGAAVHYRRMYPDFFTWLARRYGDIGI